MYVHRRCASEGWELMLDKPAFGFCAVCGNQGTIYHVLGTEDEYRFRKGGVDYWCRDGEVTHDGPVGRKYFASEELREIEEPEVAETVVKAVEQAVEAEIEDEVEVEPEIESYEPPEPEIEPEPDKEQLKAEVSSLLKRLELLTKKLDEKSHDER